MEFSTLSVARTLNSPKDFWMYNGELVDRLVVAVFFTHDDATGDWLIAYGIDPHHADPNLDHFVFEQWLPAEGLGGFFKFLIDGGVLTQSSVKPNGLIITTSQLPPPGPNAVFTYADAVSSVDLLANSVT